MSDRTSPRMLAATLCGLVIAALLISKFGNGRSDGDGPSLVVYCSCDAAIAEPVIEKFRQRTGISVEVRFDEEANKSLGLANLLLAEKGAPRCDVYWNNQALGTDRLRREGVLEAYESPNAGRIPAGFRDADFYWTGFSARLRVYLLNTDEVGKFDPATVDVMLTATQLDRVTIAQPVFGTTLSHYAVLAAQTSLEELQQWHRSLQQRGVRQVRGNSITRDLVAEGICDLGFTDTDDAYGAIDKGRPVRMLPVRLADGKTICLPNTAALIAGCPHPDEARQFIDFLLSENVELMLATASARQIPLGPVDESQLSDEVRQLREWSRDAVSLRPAANVHQQVLDWLLSEYTAQ
ncbi:MAG: extracellular solute-binding protein [Planctomycetaceae bacterium]|nr:extracellular solute-binding protein [Planctomycetaceae bacterium]